MTNEVTTNHWCNVPLHVTARGLTTSLVPHPTGPSFEIDFDFVAHRLEIVTVDGETRALPLRPRPVAEFYADVMALLAELGVPTTIWPGARGDRRSDPVSRTIGCIAAYDAEQVRPFWLALVEITRVLMAFRSRFVGKASPVHLFWGELDLATTRFSGGPHRRTPAVPPTVGRT